MKTNRVVDLAKELAHESRNVGMGWKTRVLEILARERSLRSARRESKVEAHFQGVSPVGKWMSWLDASSLDRCSEISASKDSQNLERASGLAVGRHELLFECLWLRSSECCEGVNRSESDARHLIPSNQSQQRRHTSRLRSRRFLLDGSRILRLSH